MEEMKIKLEQATNEWNEFKEKAKNERETEILDLYPEEIAGDSDKAKRRRKKAIKTVQKAKHRQYTFNFLTKHVGKREKNSLKCVRIVNE